MSSMTKDEINTDLFDECKRLRAEIERLECANSVYRVLIEELVESKSEFQTDWDKAAIKALKEQT